MIVLAQNHFLPRQPGSYSAACRGTERDRAPAKADFAFAG
jgi:hypothetical protein